ncbi:unnamed protein product [Somion occarium]|uniref:AB hydrolase-1 domain-containing protein n=1 Tax=Somion occarium TaxID=3059160 RepID=A0ABP1DCP6_9APHY
MGSFFSFLTAAYYVPKLYFASSPAVVAVRKTFNGKQVDRISLRDLVQARCPSLLSPFKPVWWLFSGHLQTLYCVLGDFSKIDKVEYDRTLLRLLDGGTIGLDFTPSMNGRTLPDETPIVVVLHGLTGGSHESYVRAILAPACTPVEKGGLGYRGVVVNFRGCAGVPVTSPQLYSAGFTNDIRTALLYISKRYPKAPLLGVGFSLGANVLTRYLAEEGEQSRLRAGCVLACPWDLLANSELMEGDWFHRTTYSSGMASNLKAMQVLLTVPRPSLIQFDDTVTCVGGGPSPPFPFASGRDYYVWASSHKLLPQVRVPFLALNASDDPIVKELPTKAGESALSPWVVFCVTEGGGHLGWFEKGSGLFSLNRWMGKPVMEWLRVVGEEVAVEVRGKALHEVNGFVMEEGRDDIGYREIGSGGHVVGVEGEEGLLAGL